MGSSSGGAEISLGDGRRPDSAPHLLPAVPPPPSLHAWSQRSDAVSWFAPCGRCLSGAGKIALDEIMR